MAKLCPARSPATRRHDPSVPIRPRPSPHSVLFVLFVPLVRLPIWRSRLNRRCSHEIPGIFLFTSLPRRCIIARLCAMNAGPADLLAGYAHPPAHLHQSTPVKLSRELHHG